MRSDFLWQEKAIKEASNFSLMNRVIMMFKGRLWEYLTIQNIYIHIMSIYGFNRIFMKGDIFDNLMNKMVGSNKCNWYKKLRTEYYGYA